MEEEIRGVLSSGKRKRKQTAQEKALEKSCPYCWGSLNPVLEKYVRCHGCNLTFEAVPLVDGSVKLRLKKKSESVEIISHYVL